MKQTIKPLSLQDREVIKANKKANKKSRIEKNPKNREEFLTKVVKWSVHLLVFLLPLFFLPITPSALESNKLMILILLGGLAGIAWIGRMVSVNELQLKRSFLSVPIILFTAVYVLSSVFSVYRENSVWGYFGGEGMSLTALLFFVLLFYVISNNFTQKKEIYLLVANFLLSSTIACLIAILSIFGVNILGFMGVSGRGFTTVGSIYSLAIYAGAILLFSTAILTEKIKGFGLRLISILALLSSLFIVIVADMDLVWKGLAFTMALLMTVGIMRNTRSKTKLFIIPTLFFMLSLFGWFSQRPFVSVQGLPVEVFPKVKPTISIATAGLKEKFLLGVGSGNFSYLFNKYHEPLPELIGYDFNVGSSYALTLFATGGILMILSFIFLIVTMGRYVGINVFQTFFGEKIPDEKKDDNGERMVTPVSLLWLFVTVMLFATPAPITLIFAWWLAFALVDALSSKSKVWEMKAERSRISLLAEKVGMKRKSKVEEGDAGQVSKVSLIISLMFVGIITGFIAVVYIMSQKHLAAYYYQKAVDLGATENPNLEDVAAKLQKAIYYNADRDEYYAAFSDVFLAMANKRITEKGTELNDEDRQYVWEAVSFSSQAANSAILVNPKDYTNHLKLALISQSIIGFVEGADSTALKKYEDALALNPTNPYIYNQMTRVYLAMYDIDLIKAAQENDGKLEQVPDAAKENLKMAHETTNKVLAMYPNYASSQLLLASIYEVEGDLDQSIATMEKVLRESGGNYNTFLALSLLYYKNKNYDQVIALNQSIVDQQPNFSDARYILGLAFAQKKEIDKAKEQFEKIQELNPDNEDVTKILADLNRGSTAFLRNVGEQQVEKVQEQVQAEQEQQDQQGQDILNPEQAAEGEAAGAETQTEEATPVNEEEAAPSVSPAAGENQ